MGCVDIPVSMALFPDPQGMLSERDVVLIAGITYTGPGAWAQTSVDVKVDLQEKKTETRERERERQRDT